MRTLPNLRLIPISLLLSAALFGQATVAPSRIVSPPVDPTPPPAPSAAQPSAQPGTPAGTQPQTAAASNAPRLTESGAFIMPNASLTEMIDLLAKRLKINYIIDPGVHGTVSIFTYGEVKPVDYMPLLETILRVNGDAMVKVGDLYRIVPVNRINQLPLMPQVNADQKTLPDDERMVMNLMFLKYATASEIEALVKPFLGDGAYMSTYPPANLLLMEDNARSMRRTMELISLFDSDQFAGQRVRLFEIEHSRPSELQKDLESVFKAYALSEKSSGGVKFISVDRINTIIAVAPNPGIFTQVESWIGKLDVKVKTSASAVSNYVYRLRYARAQTVAMAIMALYSGNPQALMALSSMELNGGMGAGGGMGIGGMMNGMGGGSGGYGGMGGGGVGGYGSGGYGGMGGYGSGGYGMGGYGSGGYGGMGGYGNVSSPQMSSSPLTATSPVGAGQTGEYLGNTTYGGGQQGQRLPHVIPNPFDNTILIQGTPQEYEQILDLLQRLDVSPRQVLIEAKIYEVDLKGAFQYGVNAYLQQKDNSTGRVINAATTAGGLALSAGMLVGRGHELLAALSANDSAGQSKLISEPSIIATDSISATLNVGDSVPVLTSQAVSSVQSAGNSQFAQSVSNVSTGVTLSILARVNSSGIVTMVINQDVSAPEPAPAGAGSGIGSPSFSNRSFQTQVTVQDGDTIAIGGIIQETKTESTAGVPVLSRLPLVGGLFGAKSVSKDRTELIVFLTPRVIYDTNQMVDATDEIRRSMKRVPKLLKED